MASKWFLVVSRHLTSVGQWYVPRTCLLSRVLPQSRRISSAWTSTYSLSAASHTNALYHYRKYSTLYKRSLLMAQFDKIKKTYPEYILLFQVGDFYELYGDDASIVASKTSLRLTKKSNVFMAGFPTKSLSEWQRTLVEAGFQLAICDQSVPKNGEKVRLLGREVVKLITPGTLVEPLDNQANYLLCLAPGPSNVVGLAWMDFSTAEFSLTSTEVQSIEEDLERICPSEVILPEDVVFAVEEGRATHPTHPASSLSLEGLVKCSLLRECHLTGVPHSWYSGSFPTDAHKEAIDVTKYLDGQGFSRLEITAAAVLLQFVMHTQRSVIPYLSPPVRYSHHQHMAIDANTRRALEIVTPLHNNTKKATLLGCIDRTVTAAGGRLLKSRLSSPLTDVDEINRRLRAVELFSKEVFHCETIVGMLKKCEDMERILQKVATSSANISDLQAIKSTLTIAAEVYSYIEEYLPERSALDHDIKGFAELSELVSELDSALSGGTYGDYIMTGYSEDIDSLRDKMKLNDESLENLIESLYSRYPDLPKLTIAPHKGYIRVLEVTKSRVSKTEKCPELIRVDHTQTKTRFSNMDLQKLNAEKQQLENFYSNTQSQLFKDLCMKVMAEADKIKSVALVLARLDVSSSLGAMANERAYSKPTVIDSPDVFRVIGSTHPVISSIQQGTFVSNDCSMDKHRLWIVTGPNMGGKSTFLRQNALVTILAQMGSFVPAKEVVMGVVDRLFARVGASDNVAKHMSTFHMEMTETANILSNATARSFVILDEIGRGTGTTEGLSIAQAVIEHINTEIGSRTLVATHFHELSTLADSHQSIGCYKLVAENHGDGIVFTYKIETGYVDHSFAIDVAQIAGVPDGVIERAKKLLLSSKS